MTAPITGSFTFSESATYFADNDLGSGSVIDVGVSVNTDADPDFEYVVHEARIAWVDWNELVYEAVGVREKNENPD